MHQIALLLARLPGGVDSGSDGGGGGGGGGGFGGSILPFVLILVVMMMLMPLFSKKERTRQKRVTQIKKHDKVVTSGGIFGTVVALDETSATLEVAANVRMRFKRSSIYDLERPEVAADDGAANKKKAGSKA
jgi:preprotein translocase subunit YajC